jgi:hypothetical protein
MADIEVCGVVVIVIVGYGGIIFQCVTLLFIYNCTLDVIILALLEGPSWLWSYMVVGFTTTYAFISYYH